MACNGNVEVYVSLASSQKAGKGTHAGADGAIRWGLELAARAHLAGLHAAHGGFGASAGRETEAKARYALKHSGGREPPSRRPPPRMDVLGVSSTLPCNASEDQ